jgi:hypothetical protein
MKIFTIQLDFRDIHHNVTCITKVTIMVGRIVAWYEYYNQIFFWHCFLVFAL